MVLESIFYLVNRERIYRLLLDSVLFNYELVFLKLKFNLFLLYLFIEIEFISLRIC